MIIVQNYINYRKFVTLYKIIHKNYEKLKNIKNCNINNFI